ncbi:CLAVATA3/ESR (CLE)-related protein 45, partial [Tanacetum coccineum]
VMILVICILLLSFGSGRAYAIRSVGLALRRVLDGIVQELDKPLDIAPSPSVTFDQYQTEKRRIRRGSDPIHNKC